MSDFKIGDKVRITAERFNKEEGEVSAVGKWGWDYVVEVKTLTTGNLWKTKMVGLSKDELVSANAPDSDLELNTKKWKEILSQ